MYNFLEVGEDNEMFLFKIKTLFIDPTYIYINNYQFPLLPQ